MGEELCDTQLTLAIKGGGFSASGLRREAAKPPARLHLCFPPFLKKEEDEERRQKSISMEELKNLQMNKSKNKKEDNEEEHGIMIRKKLRLTNEQSTLLERSFCSHKILSSIQKEELAKKLCLRPRQVEVWFQNRRARTKLKQTEVDCELLKRCCDNLSDENRRLRRELNELRFYIDASKVEDMRVCPSCESLMAEEEEKKARVLQLCS